VSSRASASSAKLDISTSVTQLDFSVSCGVVNMTIDVAAGVFKIVEVQRDSCESSARDIESLRILIEIQGRVNLYQSIP
jgi:hypothetical protein